MIISLIIVLYIVHTVAQQSCEFYDASTLTPTEAKHGFCADQARCVAGRGLASAPADVGADSCVANGGNENGNAGNDAGRVCCAPRPRCALRHGSGICVELDLCKLLWVRPNILSRDCVYKIVWI